MKALERILELWPDLPPNYRDLVLGIAEALASKLETRPTVVMRAPIELEPKPKHCPDCQDVITKREHKYCPRCGCMLPQWLSW